MYKTSSRKASESSYGQEGSPVEGKHPSRSRQSLSRQENSARPVVTDDQDRTLPLSRHVHNFPYDFPSFSKLTSPSNSGFPSFQSKGRAAVSSQHNPAAGLPNFEQSPSNFKGAPEDARSVSSNLKNFQIGDGKLPPLSSFDPNQSQRKRILAGNDDRPATRVRQDDENIRPTPHTAQSFPPRQRTSLDPLTNQHSWPSTQPRIPHVVENATNNSKDEQHPSPVHQYHVPPNMLPPTFGHNSAGFPSPATGNLRPNNSPTISRTKDSADTLFLQPETKPITQEQLINEVKGIYAGLVMVEKKCAEICSQQAKSTTKLSDQQWQALIALHRTLLHEHHDFFLASQHPTASPALRRLAVKYAMPARMWRHGIHSFLELLRRRLPDSMEHMLSFVYLAYSMMALLKESVPTFIETWIECLGDLARYRMAIEESDLRDREIWAGVARMWYNKAADLSPDVGRIQHHLAVLARPHHVQQLFYYSKSLVSTVPFVNARESILLLFGPLLEKADMLQANLPMPFENALVTAAGIAFTRKSITSFITLMESVITGLDGHIARTNAKFRVQGPEVASSLISGILDFANEESHLWAEFRLHADRMKPQPGTVEPDAIAPHESVARENSHREFWAGKGETDFSGSVRQAARAVKPDSNASFSNSDEVEACYLATWYESTSIVASKIGDKNVIPYLHVTLAFIWSLSYIPGALIYLERSIPWTKLAMFLNTLRRPGVSESDVESAEFPQTLSGTGKQLPEDFHMRGQVWSSYYFPVDFFKGHIVDEDERQLDLPSHTAPRAGRCLWLGIRISTLNRYFQYDSKSQEFSTTALVQSWGSGSVHQLFSMGNSSNSMINQDVAMDDAPASYDYGSQYKSHGGSVPLKGPIPKQFGSSPLQSRDSEYWT